MRLILALILSLCCTQNLLANAPNIFVGSREGDPESLVQNVSVIHGDYSELEVDLCVSGPDPLVLSRFYTSQDTLDVAGFGGWRFQPQTFLLMCPHPEQDSFQTPYLDIFIGTPEGSLLKFSGFQNWENPEVSSEFLIDLEEDQVGICNTAKGHPSSWTNVKNHILHYDPQVQYFELRLSSGGKRTYAKSHTPYQFHLTREVLPTGNQILYEYDEELRLKHIKMTNTQNSKTLSWITFDYGSTILATASDGTCAEYCLEKDPSGASLLTEVQRTSSPLCTYQYQVEGENALLTRKESPNGHYTEIDYEKASSHRVKTLSTPYSEGVTHTQFFYEEGVTEVQTPFGQKNLYHYDEERRLTSIEETLNDTLYRTTRTTWGERKTQGNLIALSVEDALKNTLYYKTFSYDPEGNILEEIEYGNLTGKSGKPITFTRRGKPEKNQECYTKTFTYTSSPNEDIVSQINEKGNGTLIAYLPGTSIVKRKEIHQNKQAKRRTFYDYNKDGSLTRITVDNGNTRDPNNVDYVRQRFITEITPKQDFPNLGAPEVVVEWAYNPESRNEILLKKTVNHFDSRGFVIKQEIYDRNGAHAYNIEKDYDDAGRLTLHVDPLGKETSYLYDTNGNLIQEQSQNLTTDYDYDLQNNLISITQSGKDVSPQKSLFAYNAIGNQTLEVDSLGNKTHYSYDTLGRLTQKTSSEGATWTYAYDLFDHLTLITDPLKNTTTIQYNTRGKPTHIASHNEKESFLYSLEGSLCRHTSLKGITKIFDYDYLGRITKVRYYERGPIKEPFKVDAYFYSAFQLLSESTGNGKIKYCYNAAGDLIQQTLSQKDSSVWWRNGISRIEDGDITNFAYDTLGRLRETKKWKDRAHYTLYSQDYDAVGKIVEEKIEDEQGKTLYQKQFTYTPSGELFEEIGFPMNKKTILKEHTYDSFGRLSQLKKGDNQWNISYKEKGKTLKKTIQDPLGSLLEKTYNSAGLLTALLNTTFAYDPLNNLTQEKNHHFKISHSYHSNSLLASTVIEKIQTIFSYNHYGDLTSQTIPSFEKPIKYGYDAQGNLSRIIYQEIQDEKAKEYTLTSDKNGNTVKIASENTFSLERTYNASHQIHAETLKDKWGKYNTTFQYDGEGCLTQITLPDHSSIHYLYEGPYVSKILRLSKKGKELYSYEVTDRDLMGHVLQETLPGKLGTRTNHYDTQGRKTTVLTDYFSDSIDFDPLGNPKIQETASGKEKTQNHFCYDPLSQLTSEKGHFNHSFQYDLLQNCQSKDDTSYLLTPFNQISKGKDFTCAYDDCGNLKSLSNSLGTTEFQFDALGRLIFAQSPEQGSIHYTYDVDGRRLSKVIDEEEVERYFYLEGYELGSLDEHGDIKALRIPVNPNRLENTSILTIELQDIPYVPLTDLRGSVRCLIHLKKRNIVESYHFSAFGEEEIFTSRGKVSQSPSNNPWRFQGKRHDPETHLIYYGARYYHPELQKWISPDPLGSHDSLNLYLFCHNNPLKYHDPWGLKAKASEGCGCTLHHHPGYYTRPSGCVCICGQEKILSGVIDGIADFATNTWNAPRFQGSLQAFGGLTEAVIGGGMTLGTGGLAAPVGGLIMAHGMDHFFTGLQTAFSGNPRDNVTTLLLQKTGMPAQTAGLVDSGLSIAGSIYGIRTIKNAQKLAAYSFQVPPDSAQQLTGGNGFLGHKGFELKNSKYQNVRNRSRIIQDRPYFGHALDQMQNRGFTPSVIEQAIKDGLSSPNKVMGRMQFYDPVNNISVVTEDGHVVNTMYGRIKL